MQVRPPACFDGIFNPAMRSAVKGWVYVVPHPDGDDRLKHNRKCLNA